MCFIWDGVGSTLSECLYFLLQLYPTISRRKKALVDIKNIETVCTPALQFVKRKPYVKPISNFIINLNLTHF